ncbi:MAG: hypothetical protein FJ303_19415 [Planctomycetes bacterium]|nr:hypothetical protein [Planctomycetota bacterium]
MSMQVRMGIAGITFAAVVGMVGLSGASELGGQNELNATVVKIAEALKKGDKQGAKKLAAVAVANKDLPTDHESLMTVFRLRTKKGLGFGPKAFLEEKNDGIRKGLGFAKEGAAELAKNHTAVETTGYWVAAVAELSIAKGWDADEAMKTKARWKTFSEEMVNLGVAFAEAGASKNADKIRTAADKLDASCNRCHDVFNP